MKKVISIAIVFTVIFLFLTACASTPQQSFVTETDTEANITTADTDTETDTEANITTADTPTNTNSNIWSNVFESNHWQGCPLFVDTYNAVEWYVRAHPYGLDVLLNPEQKAIVEDDVINSLTEIIDYNGHPTFWYPFPAYIGSEKYIIVREGHFIVLHGEQKTTKVHIHWGSFAVNSDDEIHFTENASYTFCEDTVTMYSWGSKRVETKLPKGSFFIDTNQNLGLVFYNEPNKEMCIVSTDTCTVSTVKNVNCVLTANYRAGSLYEYPLIITKDGTFIYFGDKYNKAMAKLYDDTDLSTDTDFGDNVMREPKYNENNIPWAGDTGL